MKRHNQNVLKNRRWWSVIAVGVVVVVGIVAAWWVAKTKLEPTANPADIAAFLFADASILVGAVGWLLRRVRSANEPIKDFDQALAMVRRDVLSEWNDEAARRRLENPVQIRWEWGR
jgi:hypothetical protein